LRDLPVWEFDWKSLKAGFYLLELLGMRQRFLFGFLTACIILVLSSLFLAGQDHEETSDELADGSFPPVSPPSIEAFWTDQKPVLDGDILNDPAWIKSNGPTDFWQTTPNEGNPASETTEVRIIYDGQNLYIGAICYDQSPDQIIISDSRRDSSLVETDSFQLILDTYRDFQNGFVFGTNPAGIEYDGQVTKEGQGSGSMSRQQSGSGGGFNLNWDASWKVRTEIGDYGWSAEFEIPFRSLRYRKSDDQVWGVNFQRNIRRRNENSFWAPLPRQFDIYRLSLAGTLTGLQIQKQRNLQVTPYILGQVRHIDEEDKTNWLGDGGVDVKYNFTPSLTLDGTYNTDFAQVEVDEEQINLDRFNLFFPEKRPFFLENAGFFSVGSPGEVELFFSRKIGIGPEGEVIPIIGGARLSGKLGNHYNIGFLNMQTQGIAEVAPSNNFTVARLSRELPNRSSIGGIFVNRGGSGEFADESDYNRTFGFDGKWGIGEYGEVSGFAAGTSTPGLNSGDYAFRFGSSYDSQAWSLSGGYTEVGEGFNPEVGFLRRDSFRKVDGMILRRYRPTEMGPLHELRPHVSYRGYWNFQGFQETGFLHVDNHWEFKSGAEVHTGINFTREGVVFPFEIYPGVIVPSGTYDHKEAQLVAFTNEGAWISARFRTNFGGFFGGNRVNAEPSMRMRLGESFNTEVAWSLNDIELPGGSFRTNLGSARVTYSFSPSVFVQSLLQYNNRAGLWSANLRFTWLNTANTGLFIVYNDVRPTSDSDFNGNRSLIVKYNILLNLLN
jgi:hypothetical protein